MQERTFEEYERIVWDIFSAHEIYDNDVMYDINTPYEKYEDYALSIKDNYLEIYHGGSRLYWSELRKNSTCIIYNMGSGSIEIKRRNLYNLVLILAHMVNGEDFCGHCSIKPDFREFKEWMS